MKEYVDAEVASLCTAFVIDSKLSAEIVLNFAIYKQNKVVRKKTDDTPQLTIRSPSFIR